MFCLIASHSNYHSESCDVNQIRKIQESYRWSFHPLAALDSCLEGFISKSLYFLLCLWSWGLASHFEWHLHLVLWCFEVVWELSINWGKPLHSWNELTLSGGRCQFGYMFAEELLFVSFSHCSFLSDACFFTGSEINSLNVFVPFSTPYSYLLYHFRM